MIWISPLLLFLRRYWGLSPTAAVWAALLASLLVASPASAALGAVDDPMEIDPDVPGPPRMTVFHPRLVPLVEVALQRPHADTQRQAAGMAGELADAGMPGIGRVRDRLERMLRGGETPAYLRLACADALVRIDDPASAAALLDRSQQDGIAMVLAVDEALVRWGHAPALAVWMQRMQGTGPRVTRVSAIGALGEVRHAEALDALVHAALDASHDPALRLEAARAAGNIAEAGLVDAAKALADGGMNERVMAAMCLRHHDDDEALALLQGLARDIEPAVAIIALEQLCRVDRHLVAAFIAAMRLPPSLEERRQGDLVSDRVLADDPRIRKLAAETLIFYATPVSVAALGPMLDDPFPAVRDLVRDALIRLAGTPALSPAVREAAKIQLHRDADLAWRGVEQAALVLGALDEESQADRLLALSVAQRTEVRVASAVALRRLAIEATLPDVLELCELICKGIKVRRSSSSNVNDPALPPAPMDDAVRRVIKDVSGPDLGEQVSQMMQMFGQMLYTPADPLMRLHIPKHSYYPKARAAAIWALGHLHRDTGNDALGALFAARLSDLTPMDPEAPEVRRFSAVSIGRMKAVGSIAAIQRFYEQESSSRTIGGSCRWALTYIDGQQRPPLPTIYSHRRGFFLEPTDVLDDDQMLPAE